jgi:hypothetical protein
MDSCEVATNRFGGSVVWMAPPSAASATNAVTPPVNTPAPDCHQGVAGMADVAVPTPTSVNSSPVRWNSGAR